jgi:hypothetical protein
MLVQQEQHLDLARRQRAGDVVRNAAADPAAAAQLVEQAPGDLAGQRRLAEQGSDDAEQAAADAARRYEEAGVMHQAERARALVAG